MDLVKKAAAQLVDSLTLADYLVIFLHTLVMLAPLPRGRAYTYIC